MKKLKGWRAIVFWLAVYVVLFGGVGYFTYALDDLVSPRTAYIFRVVCTLGWFLLGLQLFLFSLWRIVFLLWGKRAKVSKSVKWTSVGLCLVGMAYAWFVMEMPHCAVTLVKIFW